MEESTPMTEHDRNEIWGDKKYTRKAVKIVAGISMAVGTAFGGIIGYTMKSNDVEDQVRDYKNSLTSAQVTQRKADAYEVKQKTAKFKEELAKMTKANQDCASEKAELRRKNDDLVLR